MEEIGQGADGSLNPTDGVKVITIDRIDIEGQKIIVLLQQSLDNGGKGGFVLHDYAIVTILSYCKLQTAKHNRRIRRQQK